MCNLLDECNNSSSPFLFKHVHSNPKKNNSVIDPSLSGCLPFCLFGWFYKLFPANVEPFATKVAFTKLK